MLNIQNAVVAFNAGTANQVIALNRLSLSVKEGEFVTVIGANGAGKSTLFNIIAGSVSLMRGKITVDGRNVTDFPEYKRSREIGRVFQNPALGTCPGLTIRENLSLAAMRGKSIGLRPGVKRKDEDWFRELVKSINLGLEDRLDTNVSLLSGGQRQAITLIMATMMKPQILLLDEHTAALDPNAAGQVIDLTVQLANEHNFTVIMITHSMQQAVAVGNRVVMMDRGQILFDIHGEERQTLRYSDLITRFRELQTGTDLSDRTILS